MQEKREVPQVAYMFYTIVPILSVLVLVAVPFMGPAWFWPFTSYTAQLAIRCLISLVFLVLICLNLSRRHKTTPVSKKRLVEQSYEAKDATMRARLAAPRLVPRDFLLRYEDPCIPEFPDTWKGTRDHRDWWRAEHDRFITHVNRNDRDWDRSKLYYPPG